ncbi:hypothetical protein BKA67DRAFT_283360 [Truncatella angustata]|uniref:Uncharacterized protein n=1 Tax=Truncatella angustata TaxID=152316 RepID=A0A9P8ULU7_9PEZI|nr:uncharacterized protein BKA67DRAFT_283360 [Truncatella angustata]KAH6654569.1 hypothetical protein BKA67DRAFT_283360 [Truncatella angustata]KAH8203383.1 hypothetical protein TruAng_002478 [Truncatella angustata]
MATEITIRPPLSEELSKPDSEWFCRTWAVAHSTLSMWRSSRNVRITYTDLKNGSVDDLVEYEKKGSLKTVAGVDTDLGKGDWKWRGKGLLKLITSEWKVLGYGQLPTGEDGQVERWMVIWFAKTMFTEEGMDILTERKDGLPQQTLETIKKGLLELKDAPHLVKLVEEKMQPVEVKLPWILSDS